jgi:branched-chain amino acid transport system permease protein
MEYWLLQGLNGVSFGLLLFLLSAGLSLTFGVMRVLNLAHGAFYLVGGYVALSAGRATGSFLLAVVAASAAVAVLGLLAEGFLFTWVRQDELGQVLLTFGLAFILADLSLVLWGGNAEFVARPSLLAGTWSIGGVEFPIYRLLIVAVGAAVAAGLWAFLGRTTLGAIVRAAVDDMEMARGLGIRAGMVYRAVFGLGALLAGLAGALGGGLTGLYPGLDLEILVLAFVVVIIGGLGSFQGALWASLLVGLVDTFGKVLVPQLALFLLFSFMTVVLAFRPRGLAGRR